MSSAQSDELGGTGRRGRIASFILDDHRYVLLGTSVAAFVGMLLSSQPRPALSFLASAFTVELVMYYVLVAWLVLSAVALVNKLARWRTYAETSPFVRPAARRALRCASYVIWAIVAVLVVDRVAMGVASAWAIAVAAEKRPTDDALASTLYLLWDQRQTYVTGIVTTIQLAIFGTVIAFFLALLLVFCRIQRVDRSDNDLARFLKVVGTGFAKVYSTVVRGTPMLVQGIIIYYGGTALLSGSGMTPTEIGVVWSRFIAGLVVISLNSTAYMMEVLRGGIESVDKGQMEAARSLGLSQWQAMMKVVFPQGIKYAVPGLSNELVINIKDSSVLSVIGVFDIAFAASSVAGIYTQFLQANIVAAVFYLILTMIATTLLNRLSRRLGVRAETLGSTSDQNIAIEAGPEKVEAVPQRDGKTRRRGFGQGR